MSEYYISVEPEFEGTYWCERCIQGIKQEAARSKRAVVQIGFNDKAELEVLSKTEHPVLILVSSRVDRIVDAVRCCALYGIRCITMTAPVNDMDYSVSTISMDYRSAFESMIEYMAERGQHRAALFGVHPNSVNDLEKMRSFRICTGSEDIYLNNGNSAETCDMFFSKIKEYDGVICTNDIIAIRLRDYLKSRNDDIPIYAIGETRTSQLIRPGITTAALDFHSIGRHSVKLCNMLMKDPELTELHMKLSCEIYSEGRSVNVNKIHKKDAIHNNSTAEAEDFYEDKEIETVFRLENLISHCLKEDFRILRGIMTEKSYSEIASECYIAENTLKYRLKRMFDLSGCENRRELMDLVGRYLSEKDIV